MMYSELGALHFDPSSSEKQSQPLCTAPSVHLVKGLKHVSDDVMLLSATLR